MWRVRREEEGGRTLLPQVTAFWRAPMGPGAASAVVARVTRKRMVVRILAVWAGCDMCGWEWFGE